MASGNFKKGLKETDIFTLPSESKLVSIRKRREAESILRGLVGMSQQK